MCTVSPVASVESAAVERSVPAYTRSLVLHLLQWHVLPPLGNSSRQGTTGFALAILISVCRLMGMPSRT